MRAYDLRDDNVDLARKQIVELLLCGGCRRQLADDLAATWVRRADFLLDGERVTADFVVGNPPYIRLEDLPKPLLAAYRAAWPSMRGRADIYVGFIERMLRMLRPDGRAGLICADRWMRNEYGEALRKIIAADYAVDHIWSMHDVDAFEAGVAAYPAIIVMRRGPQGPVAVADTDRRFGAEQARRLTSCDHSRQRDVVGDGFRAFRTPSWPSGGSPWPIGSVERLRLLAHLQQTCPPLQDEQTGTVVSIGVATGDDSVFIRDTAPVESEGLLPLVMADDVVTGVFVWGGRHLISPWDDDGLVELEMRPRLARYYRKHKGALWDRHVARRSPQRWYRTIDRVRPGLAERPKLVLPELKAAIHPALVPAGFYPHTTCTTSSATRGTWRSSAAFCSAGWRRHSSRHIACACEATRCDFRPST